MKSRLTRSHARPRCRTRAPTIAAGEVEWAVVMRMPDSLHRLYPRAPLAQVRRLGAEADGRIDLSEGLVAVPQAVVGKCPRIVDPRARLVLAGGCQLLQGARVLLARDQR